MALTRVINSGIGVAASIAGEGTATTNLQQGLAKVWVNFNMTSTAATRDTFNHSSQIDNGTGDFTNTYASAMSNANYSINIAASRYTAVIADATGFSKTDPTTTTVRTLTSNSSFAASDGDYGCVDIHGDLA